jgi:hypothetical protein
MPVPDPENQRQFCGSGSGIRFLFDSWIRYPGWVKIKIPIWDPIRDEYFGSYFPELDADADLGIFLTLDPGRKEFKSGI